MKWCPIIATLLAVLSVGRVAEAQENSTIVSYIAGAGTPEGISGLEITEVFRSTFEASGGIGIGLAAANARGKPDPIQWSAMPRFRFGDGRRAFTMGIGASGGNYGHAANCNALGIFGCTYTTAYTIWLNAEIGGEVWSEIGLAFRYFVGYGHGFSAGTDFNIPYAGLAIGYRF